MQMIKITIWQSEYSNDKKLQSFDEMENIYIYI